MRRVSRFATPFFVKTYNDYGLGFYCTDSLEMAKEWGVSDHRNGYANCYELEYDGLRILKICSKR